VLAIKSILTQIANARRERKMREAGTWVDPPPPAYRPEPVCSIGIANREQLDALIDAAGFARSAADIRRAGRPCLYAFYDGRADESPIGATRFGGEPDLSPETSWPKADSGGHLAFFAQIDLRDLATTAIAGDLPGAGLLSFFAGDFDTGLDPVKIAIFLTPDGVPLERRGQPPRESFDDPEKARFHPVSVRFDPGLCFPTFDYRWSDLLSQANPDGDIDTLMEGLSSGSSRALGRVRGYASWSSNDLREELHFQELGRAGQERLRLWGSWDDWEQAKKIAHRPRRWSGSLDMLWWDLKYGSWFRKPSVYRPWSAEDDDNVRWILENDAAINAGVERWESLLEIDSNPQMDLWINDANPVYFFVRRDDLDRGDFSRAMATTTQH